jgi:hypothetical protein
MRHYLIATSLILAGCLLAAAPGRAQQPQLPQLKPPPPPPVKPYQAVAVTPPPVVTDPSFTAFRAQFADAVAHKDRAVLGKLIVAQGFFWMQDKDLADKRKPGMANLAAAIDLDAKDGSGWDMLDGFAHEPTGEPLPDRQTVICAPAVPRFDLKAFEALIKSTQTEPPDWGYATKDGLEVRAAAKPDAPVVEKIGLILVHVLPDGPPPDNPDQPPFLHVALPSGKTGFVSVDALSSLGGDQMCYTKETSGWKITGYYGGAAQ